MLKVTSLGNVKVSIMLEFEDRVTSISDKSWLGASVASADSKGGLGLGASVASAESKGGLGYSRKKERKSGDGTGLSSKKRSVAAAGIDKNETGIDIGGDMDSDDEQHGVIGDIETSRTSVGARKKVTKDDNRSKTNNKKSKQKNDGGEGEREDGGEGTDASGAGTKIDTDGKPLQNVQEKVPKGYWGELKAHPVEIANGEVVKRKKKKTRSKQKNILKDTRSDDKKPSYRPLSIETLTKQAKRKK
jgi:hypothetical protein